MNRSSFSPFKLTLSLLYFSLGALAVAFVPLVIKSDYFLNLFINATDAMCGKGILTIASRLSSTGALKIQISDTGKGIDKAYLPHIFEPFFTTKDPGQGTGLGLSITYGIIQKHGGFIDVVSEPGRGTTFTITLPPVGNSSPVQNKHPQEECNIG